jgi:hypothetical protein
MANCHRAKSREFMNFSSPFKRFAAHILQESASLNV